MARYKENDILNVEVTGIEKYGAFVHVDNEYSGLIHISEISTDFVRNIYHFLNIGEKIKVKVIGIDEENKQLKLSIKDINYRSGSNSKIKETPLGFSTLESNLNNWVSKRKKELQAKKEK